MSDQTVPELDDLASRSLAVIFREATADATDNGGNNAAAALVQLADETGLTLDVCAAVLTTTSALCALGQIEPREVYAASLALDPDDDEASPVTDDDDDEVRKVCTCTPDGCDGEGFDYDDPRTCVYCRDLDGEMPCPADRAVTDVSDEERPSERAMRESEDADDSDDAADDDAADDIAPVGLSLGPCQWTDDCERDAVTIKQHDSRGYVPTCDVHGDDANELHL